MREGNDKSTSLTGRLKRCGRLIDHNIDRLLKRHGVARSQYRVLYHVAQRGELTQKELTDILEVQGSTLTIIVDTLTQKGWLVRIASGQDKRVKSLRLTPAGKKIFRQIPDPVEELNRIILQSLSKSEAQALKISIEKIVTALNKTGE
jgi:DNA-binding MarR family transcriptional regulator